MGTQKNPPINFANTSIANDSSKGRYLRLVFENDPPLLYKIQFRFNQKFTVQCYERGHPNNPLNWRELESALSLCFLGYVEWHLSKQTGQFLFGQKEMDMPFVKQLSGAIYQTTHDIQNLFFGENLKSKGQEPTVTHCIFPSIPGISKSGRSEKLPFRIPVSAKFLPAESVEVYWEGRYKNRLATIEQIRELAGKIRHSCISGKAEGTKSERANSQPPSQQIKIPLSTHGKQPQISHNSGMQEEQPKLESPCRETRPPKSTWSYDDTILTIGEEYQKIELSLFDVCGGTLIFGDDDSKKTVTSGVAFLKGFLENNFGGLILTSERGEGLRWVELCKSLGREKDILWIRYGGPFKLDLMGCAKNFDKSNRWAAAFELVEMAYACFFALANCCEQNIERSEYEKILKKFLWYHFSPLLAMRPNLKLVNLSCSHFFPWEGYYDPYRILNSGIFNRSKSNEETILLNDIKSFWETEYPKLDSRVKDSLQNLYIEAAHICATDYIYNLIGNGSNFDPTSAVEGKIIILDFPLSEWRSAGVFLQTSIKYIFLRAILSRNDISDKSRPVFLFENDGENFLSEIDLQLENDYGLCPSGKGRDVRLARIFLTKGTTAFRNYLGGGENAERIYQDFERCFQFKIYHRNQDAAMNMDVAAWHAQNVRASDVCSERIRTLRNGGAVHNYESDAIVTREVWRGCNIHKVTFRELL